MPKKKPTQSTASKAEIPWPTVVRVHSIGDGMAVLEAGGSRLIVRKDGTLELSFSSAELLKNYMTPDLALMGDIFEQYDRLSEEAWLDWLRHWAEPPPSISFRAGRLVNEWPGGEASPPRRLDVHGFDDTETWAPFYRGDRFRFAHFKTKEGQEGAVIQWYDPMTKRFNVPAVFIGDFTRFMRDQSVEESDDAEYWAEMNDLFENVPMWALEQLGSFDSAGLLTDQVLEAIAQDPEALLTESVVKMLPNLAQYPEEVQESILQAADARGLR